MHIVCAALHSYCPLSSERIDYGNVVGYDKTASPAVWKSVTAATYVPPGVTPTQEFASSFKTLSNPTQSDLDEHRKRWSVCLQCVRVRSALCALTCYVTPAQDHWFGSRCDRISVHDGVRFPHGWHSRERLSTRSRTPRTRCAQMCGSIQEENSGKGWTTRHSIHWPTVPNHRHLRGQEGIPSRTQVRMFCCSTVFTSY